MDIAQQLRDKGMRITPQRLAVANMLLPKPCHLSPQYIHDHLYREYPSLSVNTVYLTLNQFERAGLVRKLYVNGKAVFDSNVSEHQHMHCQQCDVLVDVQSESAGSLPEQMQGWEIQGESRVWYGVCPDCQNASQSYRPANS